jgi:acetyl/propionyl-CoA carboxylase alpha subunit
MRRALDEYQVRGIETNLAFHRRCVRQAQFMAGDYDTSFIGRHAAELAPRATDAALTAAIIAVALDAALGTGARAAAGSAVGSPPANGHAQPPPSSEISGWRRQLR